MQERSMKCLSLHIVLFRVETGVRGLHGIHVPATSIKMLSATISSWVNLFPVLGSEASSNPDRTSFSGPRFTRSVTILWTNRKNSLLPATEFGKSTLSMRRYPMYGHHIIAPIRSFDLASDWGICRYHGLPIKSKLSPKTMEDTRSKKR